MSTLPSTSGPSMEPDYYDEPPSYAGSLYSRRSSVASPAYSPSPRHSELLIRMSSEVTCASVQDYVYRSKHITVNLGPKLWGTSIPVYGRGVRIEGLMSLSEDLSNVSSMSIKLEGNITNTYTDRGLITGSTSVDVLSLESCLALLPEHGTSVQSFSLQLPASVMGKQTPLPPTSITRNPGVTSTAKYRIKATVVRKGFHRNESLKIPFLYLPRTFAKGPLISSIPENVGGSGHSASGNDHEEVHTIALETCSKGRSLGNVPVVLLTFPSVLSFASCDAIPLTLRIISKQNPAVTKLLLSLTKIQLIKRTRTWFNGGRHSTENESLQGIAEVIHTDERGDGTTVASLDLRCLRPAGQMSWRVDGVVEQQYYIRATIYPPTSATAQIPNYCCKQPIEIATDAFESPERMKLELGGAISPAIGTLGLGHAGSSRLREAYADALRFHR